MEGREAFTFPGSGSYYIHRGFSGAQTGVLNASPGYRPLSSLGVSRPILHGTSSGSTFQMEQSQRKFSHDFDVGAPSGVSQSQPVKKKRGRPRKYGPDGTRSLGSSPMSAKDSRGSLTPSQKSRGRPPGTGRKQQLASLGEWMNSSAGLAFAPHALFIAVGEDISSKISIFAQERPRAVCIMSGIGYVSAVTLHQPASSGSTVTYEGHFQILCLSGSYLIAEEGGPGKRTGGLNVSVSSPEGHVIGGVVGGSLIAASPVQVVACSFVYGKSKPNTLTENTPKIVKSEHEGESATLKNITPNQILMPNSTMSNWSSFRPLSSRNPHIGIDLMHG